LVFRRGTPLEAAAWAVVDCETSGLDARADRLLSVAVVPVVDGRIPPGKAYAAVLRQAAASAPSNILVHGIGGEAQLGGREPAEVLRELAAFIGDAVPVAFHAPFDETVLKQAGMRKTAHRWLDLAKLLPALFPARKAKQLDEWLDAFGVACPARHDALADAWVTAHLLLACLAEARQQGVRTVESLRGLAGAGRWIT
jgi:DNA polymerase-3 subunit epsilon